MRYKLAIVISMALSSLLSCAKQDRPAACQTNFSGSSLSLRVSPITGSTYRFELCEDSKFLAPAFTVYGAQSLSELADSTITSRYRLSHVTGATKKGDQFQVTFSSDTHFVIYADSLSNGTLNYSATVNMVQGALSQASFM